MIYEEDMRRILNKRLESEGLNKFANKNDISRSFISDIRNGNRHISERVADILGYTRLVIFKKKGKE